MTDPDRNIALTALGDWARDQAQARPRLVAAAWQAGTQNVAKLARTAQVGRDTIYADLRAQGINYRDRDRRGDYQLPDFPVYALPDDWNGDRHLDGGYDHRAAAGRTRLGRRRHGPITWRGLSLRHRHGDSQLTVESHHHAADERPSQSLDEAALQGLALAINLAAVAAGSEPTPSLAEDLAANRRWQSVNIPVDATPTRFRRTTAGQHWAAYGTGEDDTDIILVATNFPLAQVQLERLHTLGKYPPARQ